MLAIPVRVPWLRSTPPADCRGRWTSCFSLKLTLVDIDFCSGCHWFAFWLSLVFILVVISLLSGCHWFELFVIGLHEHENLSLICFLMEERRESATSLTETEFRRGATASPSEWAIWVKDRGSGSRITDQASGSGIKDQGLRIRIEVNHQCHPN